MSELKIPYPEKARLAREIEQHLEHAPEEAGERLRPEELADFYDIHNTRLLKALERVHPQTRATIELVFAGGPLTALLIYMSKEEFMLDFIQQGGAAMYLILVVAGLLLLKEIHLFWRLILIKDHSERSLQIDTAAVAIGAFALVLLGFAATGLGAYFAASYVETRGLPISIFITGLRESVTCLIVSSFASALILFLHFFTRRTLRAWRVPASLVG